MIAEIGQALCGDHWVAALAAGLQVNRRTVQRWQDGSEEVPEGVWRELYEMLRQQAVENARLSYLVMERIQPR
jgi:predicted transcriptional regulator